MTLAFAPILFVGHLNNGNTALDVAAYPQAVECFANNDASNIELTFDVSADNCL